MWCDASHTTSASTSTQYATSSSSTKKTAQISHPRRRLKRLFGADETLSKNHHCSDTSAGRCDREAALSYSCAWCTPPKRIAGTSSPKFTRGTPLTG
jgi:hypothetical protein